MERNNQRNSPCTSISSESNDSVTDITGCLGETMVVTMLTKEGFLPFEVRSRRIEQVRNGELKLIRSPNCIKINENNSRSEGTGPDYTNVSCLNSQISGSGASNFYESETKKSYQVDVEEVVINEIMSCGEDEESIITISDEEESEVDVGVYEYQNGKILESDNVFSHTVDSDSTSCTSSSSEELLMVHHVSPMTVPSKSPEIQIYDSYEFETEYPDMYSIMKKSKQ